MEVLSYLAHLLDCFRESPSLETMRVVRELMDVFPEDLHGVTPDWDNDFAIAFELSTKPISISPHGMAPVELKELKE